MGVLDSLTDIPTLHGSRVTLRPLTTNDAADVWKYYSDPHVFGPTSLDVPSLSATVEAIDAMSAAFARRESIRWGMIPAGQRQVRGDCGLFNISDASAEIGYLLARDHWGRGIASEAVDILISFAFDSLRLPEVEATVMDGNERSLKLLERKGFGGLQLLPQFRDVRGEPRDYWHLSLRR